MSKARRTTCFTLLLPTFLCFTQALAVAAENIIEEIFVTAELSGIAKITLLIVLLWASPLCLNEGGFGNCDRSNENCSCFHLVVCVKFGFNYNLC